MITHPSHQDVQKWKWFDHGGQREKKEFQHEVKRERGKGEAMSCMMLSWRTWWSQSSWIWAVMTWGLTSSWERSLLSCEMQAMGKLATWGTSFQVGWCSCSSVACTACVELQLAALPFQKRKGRWGAKHSLPSPCKWSIECHSIKNWSLVTSLTSLWMFIYRCFKLPVTGPTKAPMSTEVAQATRIATKSTSKRAGLRLMVDCIPHGVKG